MNGQTEDLKGFQVQGIEGKTFLVTGGCGYFGSRLVELLLFNGAKNIVILDLKPIALEKIRPSLQSLYTQRVRVVSTDIRNYEQVKRCAEGSKIDVVFHIASYGMSGAEMMNHQLTREVNIGGTENIIKLCVEYNIKSLIYTSTYNVIFGGQELVNKDETEPYFPFDKHFDEYSRSKARAEELILRSNGIPLKNQNTLSTCALRSAAIYGEGEERHFPRIVRYMHWGLFRCTMGRSDSLVEYVYVDNLAHAHILAAKTLSEEKSRAAGEAFFVSDQHPVNNFEFLRPLAAALDIPYPSLAMPVWFMLIIGLIVEIFHRYVSPYYPFQPFITRTEVFKVSVTHYFDPKKIREILGYRPVVDWKEGQKRLVQYWAEKEKKNN
ncbi:short-chain dehydrogenase/reductase family 42E member 1-like [Planoprotostelium fungivorum]|uniref:Short-chain dehydrogenase/reductase family 42E member 1-like n=1 Tax=Planoprotostelium fungivorum TaxID=1890364 RepID=A0A2P6NJG7_9EUKA|nr:short-chain dehydrogenase/reductase family 42E member 1-like [Planoprotostelium fungivorum]